MKSFTRFVVSITLFVITSAFSSSIIAANTDPNDQMAPLDPVITANVFAVSCYGGNEGAIDITVTEGTPPYSYVWSNGDTTEDLSGIPAGSYSITVTDSLQATATGTYTIYQPQQVVFVSAMIIDATCFGGTDGGISITITGGTSPYTFLWSDGSILEDRSGLTAGIYSVVVSDFAGNCSNYSFNVSQALPILVNAIITDNTCNGGLDGSITLTINQVNEPCTYAWSNGASSQGISGLASGQYIVTVTDNMNCSVIDTFLVGSPAETIILNSFVNNVSCFGMYDGFIDLTVSGGIEPYTFIWNSGSVNEDISGLGPGIYNVTITDNDNNCLKAYFTITEPPQLFASGITTDVSCFNGADGGIDLTVSGGGTPYTYLWNTYYTGEDLVLVEAGYYVVTVTDYNNCEAILDFAVLQPNQMTVASSITDVSCFNGSNGKINITPAGGTAPYSYHWSCGDTTEDIINKPIGSYTVTITDSHGCNKTSGPYIINQPTYLIVTDSVNQISCNGAHDGSIFITVSGGSPSYYYTWNDWATTSYRTHLSPGQYTVTVTDSHGCEDVKSILIYQPFAINIQEDITDVNCFGQNNGQIIITVTGGVSPYHYDWSNGSTMPTISGLSAGSYSLTIADHKGCTSIDTFDVMQPDSLFISTTITDVTCFGLSNGAIDNTPIGGTQPYTWEWNNGSTAEDLTNLTSGPYYVTLTDAHSCSVSSSFLVGQPMELTINATIENNQCYGQSNGLITVVAEGGTLPYSYLWSNGNTNNYIENLFAGLYSITVTDLNGCVFADTFEITQPPALTISAIVTDISCFGTTDGTIDITVGGGTAPYSYLWSNDSITEDLAGLAAGSYSITVTDEMLCTDTATYVITEPAPLALVPALTDVTCNGYDNGAIDITLTGGTPPFEFIWSNTTATEDISGLIAGNYSVTVTDSRECTIESSFSINEPPALSITALTSNINCVNGNDGSIDLNVNGGTPDYTYIWSNGDTTEVIVNLEPGIYSVTVTDANNCTASLSDTVTEPVQVVTVTEIIDLVNCTGESNGMIDITATNGTMPYSYFWSNGNINEDLIDVPTGNYSVTVTDLVGACTIMEYTMAQVPPMEVSAVVSNNICYNWTIGMIEVTIAQGTEPYTYLWNDLITTKDRAGLPAGVYTLTVTDSNSCVTTASWEITQPEEIIVTASITNTNCFGDSNGEIDITVAGETPGYTYLWDDASTLGDRTDLAAGIYNLTVTDTTGCTATFQFEVDQPDDITLTSVITPVGCTGGSNGAIDLSVSGGNLPYSYIWDDGTTTGNRTGLMIGTYYITVTDQHNCTKTDTILMTEPAQVITISETVSLVSCPGGSNGRIDITASNGSGPYTYLWNDGDTNEDRTGMGTGTYTVTVSDSALNCSVKSIEIGQVPYMELTPAITNVSCHSFADGNIILSVTNGNPPYEYLWASADTSNEISNLVAGTYYVTVTDDSTCTRVASIEITEPDTLQVDAQVNIVSCIGMTDGSIDITVTGGTTPYSFEWSDGLTDEDRTGLSPGIYSVIITDSNDCSITTEYEITEPALLEGTYYPENQIMLCNGDSIIPIIFTPTYYLPGEVSYYWQRLNLTNLTGMTDSDYGLISGTLTNITNVTQIEEFIIKPYINDCWGDEFTVFVEVPPSLKINFVYSPIRCYNGSTNLKVIGSGGTPHYEGEISEILTAGVYEYTLTDANGCSVTETINITQPDSLTLSSYVITNNCSNGSDGYIEMTANGGTSPYYFNWDDGPLSNTRTNLVSGTYFVSVTDNNTCQATAAIDVPFDHQSPTGYIGTDITACYNIPHQVNVYLTGTPPWTIRYSNGYDTITKPGITSSPYHFNLNLIVNTELTLISVTDFNCQGTVFGGTQIVQVFDLPSASLVQPSPACPGEETLLEVNLTGTPPWSLTWFDGVSHDVSGIMTSPYQISVSPAVNTTYSITSISDANCTGYQMGNPKTLNVFTKPTANISGNKTSCAGEPVQLNINLTGLSPWTIVYFDGSENDTITGITSSPYSLEVSPEMSRTYIITAVYDNNCSGITSGSASVFVHPRPTVTIQALDTICTGDITTIFFHLTGTAPWNLVWNDGQPHPVYNITSSPYSINVQPGNSQTYLVTTLEDFYCHASVPGDPHYMTVSPLPTASMSAPANSCFFTGVDLVVNLTGTPPWNFTWHDNEAHVVTGVTTSPYLVHIDPNTISTYWLTQVNDANCDGIITSMPFQINVLPTPEILIEISPSYTLCEGSNLTVNGQFVFGYPPYSLVYQDENGAIQTIDSLPDNFNWTITPPTTAGEYNYVFLYISDSNGCARTYNQEFTINVVSSPQVNAGTDINLSYGQSVELNGIVFNGTLPYTINWYPSTFLSDPTILNPICTPYQSITYSLFVVDSNGCQGSGILNVLVDVSTSIFGTIRYDNLPGTPLNDIVVKVMDESNTVINSDTTNEAGFYEFGSLPAGNFHLTYETDKPYGGVNATDALLIMKHFVHISTLQGLKLAACDVDGSGYINSMDALVVAKRFTGQISTYSIPDWIFESVNFSIPTINAQKDAISLCAGDANGSYVPEAKTSPSINGLISGELFYNEGTEIVIPVRIENACEPGAISLVIDYPSDKLQITSVEQPGLNGAIDKIADGQIRISWYNLKAIDMEAGQVLFNLYAKITDEIPEGEYLSIGQGSEFADGSAVVIEGNNLLYPKLVKDATFVNLNIYPNPAKDYIEISWGNATSGSVIFELYNSLGERVLYSEQPSSDLSGFNLDIRDIKPGVYSYSVTFRDKTRSHNKTDKLLIIR